MLRPGAKHKKQNKSQGDDASLLVIDKENNNNHKESSLQCGEQKRRRWNIRKWCRRIPHATTAPFDKIRARFKTASSSRVCCFSIVLTIILSVLLLQQQLLLKRQPLTLGLFVDYAMFYFYRIDRRGDSSATEFNVEQQVVADSGVTRHWPTVEMRSRATVENYQNSYLEALFAERENESDVSPPGQQQSADWSRTTEISSQRPMPNPEWVILASLTWNDNNIHKSSSAWWQQNSVEARLKQDACQPGWWCRRCLAFPLAGSLAQCQSHCALCYRQVLRNTRDIAIPTMPGNWLTETSKSGPNGTDKTKMHPAMKKQGIPRIIHHIGRFDELPTMLSHPDWIRVQNSWRGQSGYEYHSYATREHQRKWIDWHYPDIFLAAFDFLQSDDTRQATLFALLVLFRKGGIAVSMDVLLEVQLETLLAVNELSFVGAVDARSMPFRSIMYPGFLAATPGHTIVGHAIEALLHVVAVERHVPQLFETDEIVGYLTRFFQIESLPVWRVRFAGDLCPLSVSVHRNLQHTSPFQSLTLGNVKLWGRTDVALFLLLSGNDTGASRISDIGRNMLVASTDLKGWTPLAMKERAATNVRTAPSSSTTRTRKDDSTKLLVPVELETVVPM